MTINVEEALRYLGAGNADDDLRRAMADTAKELEARITPRWTWRVFPLEQDTLRVQGTEVALPGNLARRMLADCRQVSLMACTLGAEFDRLMRAAQARDMARAVMLDACGSALVEAGCDAAEKEIAGRMPGLYLTDRFSPGYGDLPLSFQQELFRLLNCQKLLGISLNDSLLMTPKKSVTAIVGICENPKE